MRKYWYIWVIAVLGILGAAYAIFYRRKPLEFDFNLGGDLNTLLGLVMRTAQRSDTRFGAYIDVPLKTNVANSNRKKTVLENIAGNISFNGENIIQTKPGSASLKQVDVEGKGTATISDVVQLMINDNTIKMIQDLIKGNKPTVSYTMSAIAMGKPVNYTGTTMLGK